MQSAWFDATIAWISAHPHAAGGLVFLIALCDALAVVGIVVPALPLLFAVGTLIGLGHLDGPYALLCAAAGAFVGDRALLGAAHAFRILQRGHAAPQFGKRALLLGEGRIVRGQHFLDAHRHRTS